LVERVLICGCDMWRDRGGRRVEGAFVEKVEEDGGEERLAVS
jgi:hypothetical protein